MTLASAPLALLEMVYAATNKSDEQKAAAYDAPDDDTVYGEGHRDNAMTSLAGRLRGQGFAHPAVGLAKALSFGDFLNHPQTRTSLALWPYPAYLRDRAGQDRATLYVRLERIDEDIAPFEAHLGFRLTPLPRANESARGRDWRPAYSDADAALVAELCAEDIARFGYSFDGLS